MEENRVFRIPLTQGQFAIVDEDDFADLMRWKWFARWDKRAKCWYAMRNKHVDEPGPRGLIYMHRYVMRVVGTAKVDHIYHHTLDNRKGQMRIASTSQNAFNRGKASHNKSGHKGVKWVKHANKWCARITVQGKVHHLGYFSDVDAAASTYLAAAIRLHGEFARV